MAEHSRYSVSNKDAGVKNGILKNKLGIKKQEALEDAETILLNDSYAHFFELIKKGKVKFNLSMLFEIHRFFLGTLYSWAGKIRTIDISKEGMLFAPIKHIDSSLKNFEKILKKNLLKEKDSIKQISEKLAIVHNEYNAIHPFRDGNGRTIRLFLDLIVWESGYEPIDWGKKKQRDYFNACIRGMSRKQKNMERIIYLGLKKRK
ncbi:MAG TPA: hypothetical protein ENI66_01170 [Candidatus Yonathbacteria bacterium]|nr:hypothetical protein [Candidatus Yonathbacteria bacterium]